MHTEVVNFLTEGSEHLPSVFSIYEQSKTKVSFGTVVVGMSLASAKMVLCVCVCVCMCTHVYAWIDVPVCKQIEASGWYCVSSESLHIIIINAISIILLDRGTH